MTIILYLISGLIGLFIFVVIIRLITKITFKTFFEEKEKYNDDENKRRKN